MRIRRAQSLLILALPVLLASACAGARSSSRTSSSRDVLTQQQIGADGGQTVYAVVQRLRPRWLQKRGSHGHQSEEYIVVYLDNGRLGGPESLREILAAQVESVRFLDPSRAQYRYGAGHTHGAILVTTKSR